MEPTPPSPESAELAALARKIAAAEPGVAAAEEERLVHLLGRRVWLYGVRHLRDESAADDLVQKVLLTVLERLRAGEVQHPERLASFVLGTCRNGVRDLVRGERRRRSLLERYGVEPVAVEAPAPLVDRRLGDCMGRLSDRERTVVALTFYAERGAAEIAAELTLSPGNVRVLRHRALARLRDCLDGVAGGPG